MLHDPFESKSSHPLLRDFCIFLDSGLGFALLLGLLLLACIGAVIVYANIKYGLSPF